MGWGGRSDLGVFCLYKTVENRKDFECQEDLKQLFINKQSTLLIILLLLMYILQEYAGQRSAYLIFVKNKGKEIQCSLASHL